MAYSFAPRFSDKILSGTPKNLAPNNYIICDKDYNLKNRVPFLSSSRRKLSLGQKLYTHSIYNPLDSLPRNIIGGASLRHKAKRLRDFKSDTPGPAEYDPKIQKKGCKYVSPPCHGTGRLYVCRVPYTISVSAPSIPTRIDENGYDLTVHDDLIKNPADFHDTTRGPAFYDVPMGEIFFTTRRYHKGCAWSKSKTKRDRTKIERKPGPGDYDLDTKPFQPNPEYEEYRKLAKLLSFLPRYTEGEMMKTTRDDMPGPGHYTLNLSTIKTSKSCSINPPPMVVGAPRFRDRISDNPGPGEYETCDTVSRSCPLKDVPFGNGADRFKPKKTDGFPGPGAYQVKGAVQEKLDSKLNPYSSVDVPFFKTDERKMSAAPPDAACMPGPGQYDVEYPEVEKEGIHSSIFRSRTARFRYKTRNAPKASAASYNITEAFKKNHSRTSHNSGKVAFLSSAKREEKYATSKNPGPSDYVGQSEMGSKGTRFSTATRFTYKYNDNPPPGHYKIHPSVDMSIYRAVGTHNLRLKEMVKRTKLKLPPSATFESWMTENKKHKKLRWFSKPTEDYEHCLTCL